jgi:hypothetical protein
MAVQEVAGEAVLMVEPSRVNPFDPAQEVVQPVPVDVLDLARGALETAGEVHPPQQMPQVGS